ncbi:hypothetical protein Plec18167_001565 [Paecilomyces lecythidis]|uniref:RING-type domain-containing protein n=1 Tax=Paecilomyces lecythidis TaxID=3004212 RepID=A0ABR3YA06_9EURO
MGSSSSHTVKEEHPQTIQQNLPSRNASGESVIQPPQPACTAASYGPGPNPSPQSDKEQSTVPVRELQSAQAAPETTEQHNLDTNKTDDPTTLPAPTCTSGHTMETLRLATEDMRIQDASTGPAAANNASTPPEEENEQRCEWCCDRVDVKENMLHCCTKCDSAICKKCIRKLFLDACKSELDMPPRCCAPIPLAFARDVLSEGEISLFKDKYEEWSTADRMYCPVPTCSAFIPPRLLPDAARARDSSKDEQTPDRHNDSTAIIGISTKAEIDTPPPTPPHSYISRSSQAAASVHCPKCEVRICCSCKQLAHDGSPCSDVPDIDPLLERALRKWGYKRCIKCHAAVRKMWGCSHMRCRCGAQWCWFCTSPIEVCRVQGCPSDENHEGDGQEDGSETSGTDSDSDSDSDIGENFDSGSEWINGTEDFGEGPDRYEFDIFTCEHCWESPEEDVTCPKLEYDCARCWKKVVPRPPFMQYQGIKSLAETGSLYEQQESQDEPWVSEDEVMQRCYNCSLIVCPGCRDELDPDER